MKINRNDNCPCDSGKKYKNCCGKKNSSLSSKQQWDKWIALIIIAFLLGFIIKGLITYNSPEESIYEYYRCDNPQCTQQHKRLKVVNPAKEDVKESTISPYDIKIDDGEIKIIQSE